MSIGLINPTVIADGESLLVGHDGKLSTVDQPEFQILGTGSDDAAELIARFSADASGPHIDFVKSRNAAINGHAIVVDNDVIGGLRYYPDDGVDFATLAAEMLVEVDDASPAAGDIGTAFVWTAMPGGGGAIREVMRISASGNLTVLGSLGGGSIGGFTEGSVIIADNAGVLSEDNAGLFFKADGNFLGINKTSPTQRLQLVETTTSTNLFILMQQTAASGTGRCILWMNVLSGTTGDPEIDFNITGGSMWVMGVDNSQSDRFVIAPSTALGNSGGDADVLQILIDGTFTIGAPGASVVAAGNRLVIVEDGNVRMLLRNGANANPINIASISFRLKTTVSDKEAARISSSWSDQIDASKEGMIEFKTANVADIPTDTIGVATRLAIRGDMVQVNSVAAIAGIQKFFIHPEAAPATSGSDIVVAALIDDLDASVVVTGQTGNVYITELGIVTLTAPGSETIPVAATLKITGAPLQAGSATITATYSLWIAAGNSLFDGAVGIGIAPVSGTQLTFPQEDDAATPTLAFGDGNTGFYESADNSLNVATEGTARFLWVGTAFRSVDANGPAMLNVASSDTVPGFVPDISDPNTGIGQAGADILSLIAGGVENIRMTATLVVINEGSANIDLRIEGENNTNMLVLDAALDIWALGTTVTALTFIKSDRDFGEANGNAFGISTTVRASETVGNTATTLIGISSSAYIGGSNEAVTNDKDWTAALGLIGIQSTIRFRVGSTGTITGGALFHAQDLIDDSSAIMTNQYGLFVDALTGATNNYGIWIATPTGSIADAIHVVGGRSFLGGDIVVGGSSVFNELGLDSDFRVETENLPSFFTINAGLNTMSWGTGVASASILVNSRYDFGEANATVSGIAQLVIASETVGNTGTVTQGISTQVWLGGSNEDVTNNKNWTATVGFRGVSAHIRLRSGSSGTITGASAFFVSALEDDSSAVLTNHYGLYVSALTGATNNYGVWIETPTGSISDAIHVVGGRTFIGGNLTVNGIHELFISGSVVFNQGGADIDFRVESANEQNIFVIDAGLDAVSFGTGVGADTSFLVDFTTRVIAVGANGQVLDINPKLTEAASGTHAYMAGLNIQALTVTNGDAATTIAATVRIGGPATGGGVNLSLWVVSGTSRFVGDIDLVTTGTILNVGSSGNNWIGTTFTHAGSGESSITRTSAATNTISNGLVINHETSNTIVDGFGIALEFGIQDGSGAPHLGSLVFQRIGADNTGEFVLNTRVAGSDNVSLKVSSGGQLSVDLDSDLSASSAAGQVFDDYDDPMALQKFAYIANGAISAAQRAANVEMMLEMGVVTRVPGAISGYHIAVQPMFRLIAGGIYQNRWAIDEMRADNSMRFSNVEERLTDAEKAIRIVRDQIVSLGVIPNA